MLEPLMHVLSGKRLVLASSSPRRRQILETIGLKVDIVPSTFEENLNKSDFSHPSLYVEQTAYLKALDTANILSAQLNGSTVSNGISNEDGGKESRIPFVIIAADTIVAMDGKIYEKPLDYNDAVSMLTSFSGRSHDAYTGVALLVPGPHFTDVTAEKSLRFRAVDIFHVGTEVEFDCLTNAVIRGYVDSKEPMDKAGAYGIHGKGGSLIKGIKGDFFNVMGFPLHEFSKHMTRLCEQFPDVIA